MAGVRAAALTASEAVAASATKVFLSMSVLLKTGVDASHTGAWLGADVGSPLLGASLDIAAASSRLRRLE